MPTISSLLLLARFAALDPAAWPAGDPELRPPQVCFAPGTDADTIETVDRRTHLAHSIAWAARPRAQTMGRFTRTATDGSGLDSTTSITLTWSYPPDGTPISSFVGEPASPSNLRGWLNAAYPGGFAEWHALLESVFASWGAASGIRYLYEPADDGASFPYAPGELGRRGDIRIVAHLVDGTAGVLGYNFQPNTGDMVLDSQDGFYADRSYNSRRLRNVIAHEHGHGLGMQHVCPSDGTKLMEPYASTRFEGPQHDDLLGVQRLYGDRREDDDLLDEADSVAPGETVDDVSNHALLDDDWFSLATRAGDEIEILVAPKGAVYLQGPQYGSSCGATSLFDSRVQRDLGFEVVVPSRTTTLVADDAPAGQAERLRFISTETGPYHVRVFGSGDDTAAQLYRVTVANLTALRVPLFVARFESGGTGDWSATCDSCGAEE